MKESAYYPIFGPKSMIHIFESNKKPMLCGRYHGRWWECAYGSEVYPEIKGLSFDKTLKTEDFKQGLFIANEHVPRRYFCHKCYNSYISKL